MLKNVSLIRDLFLIVQLIDNEMAQNVFSERSKKLDRLEQELDNTHTKMQDMLENFSSIMEQVSPHPYICDRYLPDSLENLHEQWFW